MVETKGGNPITPMSFLNTMQSMQKHLSNHRKTEISRLDMVNGIKYRMGCLLTPDFSKTIDRIFGKDRHPVTFEPLDYE